MRLFPPPTDSELRKRIWSEEWFQVARRQRIGDELEQLKEAADRFEGEQRAISGDVTTLLTTYGLLLDRGRTRLQQRRLATMIRRLRSLRQGLLSSRGEFTRGPYRRFSYAAGEVDALEGTGLRALAENVHRRCESLIGSGTQGLLGVIDRLTRNCVRLRLKGANHGKKGTN
jgi:hypothetical protein